MFYYYTLRAHKLQTYFNYVLHADVLEFHHDAESV